MKGCVGIRPVTFLLRGTFKTGLLFLLNLAWESRIRLPFLIAIGFMVLDMRMQLEINIDMVRQIPRLRDQENGEVEDAEFEDEDEMWETEEEYESEEESNQSNGNESNQKWETEEEYGEEEGNKSNGNELNQR